MHVRERKKEKKRKENFLSMFYLDLTLRVRINRVQGKQSSSLISYSVLGAVVMIYHTWKVVVVERLDDDDDCGPVLQGIFTFQSAVLCPVVLRSVRRDEGN